MQTKEKNMRECHFSKCFLSSAASVLAGAICIVPLIFSSTVTLSQQVPMPRFGGGIVLAQRTDRPASLPKIRTGTCADMIGCFLIRPDDWSSFRENAKKSRPIFEAYLKADGSSTMTQRANGVASPAPDWVEADSPTFCKGWPAPGSVDSILS